MRSNRDEELAKELQAAVIALNPEKVKALLLQGALPLLVNNTTATHLAVCKPLIPENEKKAVAILEVLLPVSDINQIVDRNTVMSLAGRNSLWQAVILIAKVKKTDMNDRAQFSSALLDLVRFCKEDDTLEKGVDALLDAGAKINMHNYKDGYTALHWAIVEAKPSVVRLLVTKFPDAWVTKSTQTEAHGKGVTATRLAANLLKQCDANSNHSHEHRQRRARIWQCFCAMAEVAYLPIIEDEKSRYREILKKEKDIIFTYVCDGLPPAKMWQAIRDGQNDMHELGSVNYAQTGFIPSLGSTNTVADYAKKEKVLREQGYPEKLTSKNIGTSAELQKQFSSAAIKIPSKFNQAPRIISDYRGDDTMNSVEVQAGTPLFTFSPPPSSAPVPIEPSQQLPSSKVSSANSRPRSTSTSPGVSARKDFAAYYESLNKDNIQSGWFTPSKSF